jgi:hypothetical protein
MGAAKLLKGRHEIRLPKIACSQPVHALAFDLKRLARHLAVPHHPHLGTNWMICIQYCRMPYLHAYPTRSELCLKLCSVNVESTPSRSVQRSTGGSQPLRGNGRLGETVRELRSRICDRKSGGLKRKPDHEPQCVRLNDRLVTSRPSARHRWRRSLGTGRSSSPCTLRPVSEFRRNWLAGRRGRGSPSWLAGSGGRC